MMGQMKVCCGNCKHFSKDKKHPSTGGCAIYSRMTMRMSWCQKHEMKEAAPK
jgi:hypothetical protein